MATTQVNALVARASTLIQDATNVRWPIPELVGWLNDGQREVALNKPEASVKNVSVALIAGSTKQTLPADAVLLIDVVRNTGSGGSSPGTAVRLTDREVLDAQRPTWHSDANTVGYIQHYTYDTRDPKNFYVYPKAPGGGWQIEVVYSSSPQDAVTGGVISIDDTYANALLDYILYRAYSKDAEYAGNANLAVAHYTAFANSLGIKTQNDMSRNPNAVGATTGFNPNVPRRAA